MKHVESSNLENQKLSIEVRQRRPWRRRAAVGLGVLATGGGLLFFGDSLLHAIESIIPGIHAPNIDFGDGPAHGTVTPIPNADTVSPDFIQCSDEVTAVNGVQVSSRDLFVSGYKVNHAYPVRFLVCGPNGFGVRSIKAVSPDGEVKAVLATEASYVPTEAGVDYQDAAVICEDNPADSNAKHLEESREKFAKAHRKRQIVPCDYGESTTGFGVVTDKVPGKDEVLAADLAQIGGEISPLSKKVQEKIINDSYKETEQELKAAYPEATITLVKAPLRSDVQQIKALWNMNGANIDESAVSYKFENTDGETVFHYESEQNGGSGDIQMPDELTTSQVNELNYYIHTAHPASSLNNGSTTTTPNLMPSILRPAA